MDKSDLVKFRSECIAAHNFYRSLHGTTPLVWSTRLADGAQKWAEQLASADSLTYSQERGVGENIACLWGSDVTGNKVTQIWYEESQNYDYSAPRVTPNNRPFCQVVWEGCRELGAGKAATKNGKQVVVARYHPPVSRKQVEKNVKLPKLDRIDGSTALATRPSVGLRKFQEECLFAHNEFRVLHGAPPLHWSPSLAWAAQQWAEKLAEIGELKHNNDELVGENLAGMVGDELTGKECTDMWYEEVKDFDFENPCYSEETSNFSQVVWIGSELFGVGRANLGDTCIVVAFYEPPGNIEGLFGSNVRLQGTKVKTYRLTKEMKTFIPPSPDLDWFRIECLVAHNYFRARHGAPPLVIGQALNEEAQYWAERLLVTGATEDLQESRIGINVAIIHGHHVSGLKVTELWYDEGTGYNFESPGFSLSTRSFTQLIWLSSRKLGIGKATNNSGQCVIVARYEPVGNIDGLFVTNVRRRGQERNALEPMIFESDVKYRFKVEGRRSFRMSWEIEGTQTLQAVDKARDKTRRKEQAQPAYLSSPETFTRLVWIESPVLPRKQMRESCDLEMERSDEDKESGVEEGEEFEQEEPSFIVVHPIAEAAAARKQFERAIVYTEPQRTDRYPDVRRSLSLDSEGTEPEPEEGHVLSRVAYFQHFEKIEKEKLDRPKRSSIELKEQLRHNQFGNEEEKSHKISEHEENVCQLEYDDVFPKHDENDERDDDFASEGEAEDDDDDVMSLETVSEAGEDLLEELDEYEMDHHIKSYCYEVNYPREEDERNINQDQTTDERGQIAEIIETELDKMDKEQVSQDPDHCVASSADRDDSVKDQMRVVDTHIEFVPIQVEKRRTDFNPDDVIFNETEEEKELFKSEIKTPEKEKPSMPLCTESVNSEKRDRLECELNVDVMFSRLDKPEKPKEKPPPTLPKPKRKLREEVPSEARTEIIRTVETTQTMETTVHRKTEPESVPVQREETVHTFKEVTEEKPTEQKTMETTVHRKTEPESVPVQREETVHTFKEVTEEKPTEQKTMETTVRRKTEPESVPVQREETVHTFKEVTEEKPTEQKPMEAESKQQSEEEEEALDSDEEALEVFDLSFIDRERKLNNIFKRLGRRMELIPTETKTAPREFDRNIDLSDTKEEEEWFRSLYVAPVVEKTWNKSPVQEETIFAEHRKKDVESEIDFEELFERLEKGEETLSKEAVLEPSQDLVVLESERVEEEPQEEKLKVVRFDKTVIVQEHETVYNDFVELKESVEDHEDHGEEYEEVDHARTEELQQITPEPPVYLAHECEEPGEFSADTSDQEEEEAESYGEEEEVRTSVSPIDNEETTVQFSEELSERNNSYGTCEVDTIEPSDSVADVYEEYEPTPVTHVSETSCSRPIHVAADVDNKPLESGVEEESVRTSMYESFEEVLPEASASSVIEPSTCYVAAEINHRATKVEPVEEDVEVAVLSSDEEPETIDKIAVHGIPESTESTVCITTETTFHHRTEIVQKRAPSIEMEMPLEKEEEEPSYKEILSNGHCTSVHISHDIDERKTEIITETESYETEISQTLEEDKVSVSEVQSDLEIPSNISVQLQQEEEEKVEETVEEEEEEVEQLEQAVPATEDVEETIEEREEEKEEETVDGEQEEEVEQLEEAVPVTEDVEETVEEREEEKEEETVEEEEKEVEQLEEAVPVTEDVEETVEEREEEKEEETVEEEEKEVEQLEEAVPVTEYVEETVEEREEEKQKETVEEEEEEVEQLEEAVPVTEDVEETVEEREEEKEEETVDGKQEEEFEQPEEAVPVTEDVEETVEEREEEKEEETVEEEEEEVEQLEEAVPVTEDVEETVEEREEEKEEETVEEEEEEEVEHLEQAVPVTEDVEETVEEREEEKEEETVEEEEEEEVEQLEEAVPVTEDVEDTVEEREEEKEEETVEEEEEEVEQLEEAVPVTEDVEETVEEREEEKEEETVEEEEEVEQLEEAVPVTEDVEETVEEREEEKEEETVDGEQEEEFEQPEEAVPVTEDVEETVEEREEEKEEETVEEEEEEVEQLEEAVPVTEDVEETVEEREEEKEEETVDGKQEEEFEQPEEAVPVTEDVEETVEEREEEKEEETVEEEEEEVEQLEEAVPVTEDVEETVEEREEEKEEETVEEEEEEVEQLEEVVPVTEDVEETVEEREEEKEEETVEEEEEEVEQPEEAVPVTEDVEETVEEREEEKEEETVEEEEEEVEQLEEAVPVTEDVEETVEEREEEKEEETVEGEQEEEVEQPEEAVPVTEDVEETVEEREEEKEEETVEEEEEEVEQLEEAVPVTEDVEETVEEREEEKEEETVDGEQEEEFEQPEEAVPVTEDVEETVEEREEEKEEETVEEEEEEEVEQLEEAVPVTEDVEEMVEEREEEKEEETVEEEEEEEVEQLEEAVPVTEDVEETVEEREEEKEEETVEEEEEEVERLEEAVPVTEDVEETVEEREEEKVEETIEQAAEDKQEAEFTDGSEEKETEEREQVEETETQKVVVIEKLQTLAVDDRFEYISEEELEETEELYEALRESFEEQDNEELIDEENVYVQQTAAGIIHISSQEEENYEAFVEEQSEDEITYDSEVITEVEKEITSALVVKESFSSAVCEDETANENIDVEERETESPVEETQPETLLQFSEPVDENVSEEDADDVDEREPDASHDDSDDVFLTEEQTEPSETPEVEECEELESSDEIIDKKVELIQFTEEITEEEKLASEDEEVFEEEKSVSESEERPPTPDEEEEGDNLDSSEEFAEENVELIQFDEQVDEDKVIDQGSEVDEPYPLSPDVIEEKQIVTESGVELIQFTEHVEEERVEEGEQLEQVESEDQKDEEQITDEKTELIQFVEHTEEIESTPNGQAEELLEEYVTEDSGKVEVEEELMISQPIACSTPIFLDENEQTEETTSFEDSAEAGFGEGYEDMEKIVAHDHSLDVSQPVSLEESSDLSNEFYKAEAEEAASKAVAEEFDDSGKIEAELENLEEEEEKEQTSVTSSSVVTTTVYEKRIIKTGYTKREFVGFTPLESADGMLHEESREDHLSPPPTITATEFVADEEEEGSEEEYIPNFEHPRTYMMESKEVVMDRNTLESKVVEQEESAPEKEEHEEPAVGIQAPSEMETKTEVVESEPGQVETETTTVTVSHRSEVVRKQESDIDDLEEKELEERIQRKQKAMEENLLQDEIKDDISDKDDDIPDKRTTESEESRTELFFTSISVVKVEHEDDEQRIFREEEATIMMLEDELKLEENESSTEELDVMKEDEALTEAAFRAERQEEEHKTEDSSDEPDQGQRADEVAQVPIIPLMAASDVAYKTSKSDKEIHEDVDYQEEVEVERIESSFTEEEEPNTHPVVLTDVDFTEEIEVEKVQEEPEEEEEEEEGGTEDVYEEEVEIQRVENQEEGFKLEYPDDEVFEEEVIIERIEEEHEEEQESSPDVASLPVYEEELEVAAAEQIPPQQPVAEEENIVHAEQLHEDAGENNEVEQVQEEEQLHEDAGENNEVIQVQEQEQLLENAGENNEVEQVQEEEQAWEEYEEMEEQDQEIPQEIQGIADQSDMHLYDNNNNESLPRYYVDFSPGGSFERESTTSDDGEGPGVYRQGEPMEEDMEEFILVKYEDQSSSSGEDISDHREMYVIHEEDSEDRADEKKGATDVSQEEKVAFDQGFVNPALEDIREEDEEEKQKHQKEEGEEVDFEEKRQLAEYERLESFVILEEKLSQVESDESFEDLTSGTDGKRASSEETLNDEDELSETMTSSTLKDETTSKDDASGDEVSSPESQEPSALDTTLTKEIEEETIDLEDGGVLSKRTVREESYSIEEDDGDDDDKDKTLTRKKVSKRVVTTTSTSETHVKRIESVDNPSPTGSDNESEPQEEREEDVTTTDPEEQPEKQLSRDEESSKETEESPESGNKRIETEEEIIDLDDGGVVKRFVTREETYTVDEGNGNGEDDQDSSISRKTVSKKIVTTTTTSTSRVTRLGDEPSSSFSDDDANRVIETSSEETHTTIIKSRQPEEPPATAKRQLSLENSGASSEACAADPSRKRRGCIKRFDSHDSEGHSSEVSSTTDSTGDSTSISSEGHVSDEDFSGLDEFQIDCIRQHNIYRHRHRACRLLWSEDLAAAAAEWADHLAATKTLEHSPQKECGENLACAKGYDLRGDKVADMWYEEIKDYNFETPAFNAKCGHFTQTIWRATKEFGVAKSIADDGSQYVVARYNPPGNVLGEFKDSIRRSRGQKTSVRKRRRSSSRRQLSHSSDMSDVLSREKFKNECVISHNYYRSLHGAPTLQWSTMLATEAQNFAEKLTKSGSFMHSESKEIGECLAFSFGLDLSGRDAVDTWYDEIVDYDYEYPGYTSHTANFTQVVWAGSKEFGMGKAIGDDGSCVVVGRYYPPGNIVGDFQENVKQKGTGYY